MLTMKRSFELFRREIFSVPRTLSDHAIVIACVACIVLKEQLVTFTFSTVGDLKKKMNGLRTYHRTLWKKRNDLGAIEENTPSWQYYDQLMFLNDHFQPRETMATLPKRKLNMEETPDADGEQSEFEYTCNVNNPGPVTKSKRLWKPTHENEVIMKSVEYCKGKNPEMLFGALVGHSLTSIKDERNREYAKLQIQQILFKCRYPETDPRKFPQLSQLQSSVEQTNSPEL